MYLCTVCSLPGLPLRAHARMYFADVTFVHFSDVTFWVCLRLKLKFLCYSAEHSTGVECECGVHAVKLHQVRRSGKFGEAKAEQKEWNLASSLGSERFLLAFCQKVGIQQSITPKVISRSCCWVTCRSVVIKTWKLTLFDKVPHVISPYLLHILVCLVALICSFAWIKHLSLLCVLKLDTA